MSPVQDEPAPWWGRRHGAGCQHRADGLRGPTPAPRHRQPGNSLAGLPMAIAVSQPHQHRSLLPALHRHSRQQNPPHWLPALSDGGSQPWGSGGVLGAIWTMLVIPAALAQSQPCHAPPSRETEAGEGVGAVGTQDPPDGAGGRQQLEERVNNREAKALPHQHQAATRGVERVHLGLTSTEGHTCDKCARSQHNRTDSAGGCGLGMGGLRGTTRGDPHPKLVLAPTHRWECAGKMESFPGQQVGPGWVWGSCSPMAGSLQPRLLQPGSFMGWQRGLHCWESGVPRPLSGVPMTPGIWELHPRIYGLHKRGWGCSPPGTRLSTVTAPGRAWG